VRRGRDKAAALKPMRRLLKKQGFAPTVIVTDTLRSYAAAFDELGLSAEHERGLRQKWLQGFSDQAVRTAEMSIDEAQATGHAMSLCYTLALAACPIALWVGNLTAAAHYTGMYTGMLLEHSRKHSMPLWSAFGFRFERVVVLKGGDLDTGSRLLRTGLDEIAEPDSTTELSVLAEALSHAGRIAEASVLVEAGIEQSDGGWLTPELLRLKGELFLLQNSPAVAETTEDLFRQALDGARRQEAYLGSCALRRASPGCCAIAAEPPMPSPASSRSTTALRRVSTPPI
jgi:hypothetical protein